VIATLIKQNPEYLKIISNLKRCWYLFPFISNNSNVAKTINIVIKREGETVLVGTGAGWDNEVVIIFPLLKIFNFLPKKHITVPHLGKKCNDKFKIG